MEQAWEKLEASWVFHFFKGFFSLGVIGFVKTMLASPFFFFSTGGRRRRGNGRDRYNDMSLVLVLIGAATFIFATWKFVQRFTKRLLDNMKETVVDVQADDSDDDNEPQ